MRLLVFMAATQTSVMAFVINVDCEFCFSIFWLFLYLLDVGGVCAEKQVFYVLGTKVPSHFYCQLSSGKGVDDLVEAAFGSHDPVTSPPVHEKRAREIEVYHQPQNATLNTNSKLVNDVSRLDNASVETDNNASSSVNVTDSNESELVNVSRSDNVSVESVSDKKASVNVNHTADNVQLHRVHLIRNNETLEDLEVLKFYFCAFIHQIVSSIKVKKNLFSA